MDRVIAVPRDTAPMRLLWSMGADDFGVQGNRLILRVSQQMLDELTDRGVAYELLCTDLDSMYRQYREGLGVRRKESFIDYHDPDEAEAAIRRIAQQHPEIVALEEIGRSVENRPILALRISDAAAEIDRREPAILVMGCHHAREWISVEVPLYYADYLAENYRKNGAVTRLINYAETWVVPIVNPDGYAYSWRGFPNSFANRWWRKNRRNNGDGTYGVDPNRNYVVGFGDEEGSSSLTFSEVYRGPEPFSEPETRAIRELMTGAAFGRTFKSAMSYHNFSQLVMYPNGYTRSPVTNAGYYRELAAEMTRLINASHTNPEHDYVFGTAPELLYIASGTFEDWAHHTVGATAFIIELRPKSWPFFELPPNEIIPTCQENLPALLFLAEQTLIPDLKNRDADLDGYVAEEDYCLNTPAGASVDDMGCAASEQDLDQDGVPNRQDQCRDTPSGQRITSDGCRVPALFSVDVRSNVTGVQVDLVPQDIDAQTGSDTGSTGFRRDYAEPTAVALTAPSYVNGNRFTFWRINGQAATPGQPTIRLEDAVDVQAEAVYLRPVRVEIAGPERIPDRRPDGQAYSIRYTAHVVYEDGSTEVAGNVSEWSVSDRTMATVTQDGELLAFDVGAVPGEVKTELSAKVALGEGGRGLDSIPKPVAIFDTETGTARCREISIQGPDRVDSLSAAVFEASILLDGDIAPRVRDGLVEWSVPASVGASRSSLPAVIDATGRLETDWVGQDQEIVVRAAVVNDDSTVCLAETTVVINAGSPEDDPSRRTTIITPATTTCGAMGAIGLFGLLGLAGTVTLIGRQVDRKCPST